MFGRGTFISPVIPRMPICRSVEITRTRNIKYANDIAICHLLAKANYKLSELHHSEDVKSSDTINKISDRLDQEILGTKKHSWDVTN
jgi:hypothetical protein